MNRTIKTILAALAVSTAAAAYAQDVEEESSPVGWTPIALGIATPVQLPWGIDRWDVYGLDLNLFYSDAPTMIGLDVGGFATVVRRETMGVVASGLFNFGLENVYGLRGTIGLNLARRSVYGFEFGTLSFADYTCGLSAHILGNVQRRQCGLQIAGIGNFSSIESYGCSIAGLCNLARTAYGAQIALIYNMTDELHGAQIGLVNYTDDCRNGGFQIGLVNIIMSNRLKVLPIVNGYF